MPASSRPTVRSAAFLAVLGLTLAGCATTAPGGGTDAAPGGGGDSDGGAASALNCDKVATAGWELMTEPRASVEPSGVVPLTKAGEKLTLTDSGGEEYTTYSYQLGYIDDLGTVFPNQSGGFDQEMEKSHVLTIEGPFAPTGVDGGPYAGVLQIDATSIDASNNVTTTTIARVCVQLATEQ
ncbi:MAG: hypothetical protein DI534_03630 [Leifsonia xyli]|nr:MAG: hypothetical protein DI534_03630 [Leifsonia xyli]